MSETTMEPKDVSWYKRCCTATSVPASEIDINQDNLWTGTPQVLRYWFLEGTDVQMQKVRDSIKVWTYYANILFQEARSANGSDVRIRFDSTDASWSYFGRQNSGIVSTDPTMNIAWLDRNSPLTMNERAVILHQFGHALGLQHEHRSPASGGIAIKNIQAAIDLYTKTSKWTAQEIYDRVITVYGSNDISNYSEVDLQSIMHFPLPKELTGLPQDIPYNQKLSDIDIAYMVLQYPCKSPHPHAVAEGWTFDKALSVIGCADEVAARILSLLESDRDSDTGEISPINIRETLQDWIRSARATADRTSQPFPDESN